MKKILFILPYYKIGGTLTSFANLIPLIDKEKYEISAFALTNEVDDIAILPKGVNYIGLKTDKAIEVTPQKSIKSKIVKFLKSGKRLLTKFGYDPSDIVFKKMAESLSNKYDTVIAFQEGQPTRMAQYISAPKKIAWIHCIYSRFKSLDNKSAIKAYNSFDNSIYQNSGRGYSREGQIKPDLTAPGVNITIAGNRLGQTPLISAYTGASLAAAITAGAAAQFMQWAVVDENAPFIRSQELKNYFIRGAAREPFDTYPNRIWGYGRLDLYGTFVVLRNN